MTNLVAAFMCLVCFAIGATSALLLFFWQSPAIWTLALGGPLFGWLFASMIEENPDPE